MLLCVQECMCVVSTSSSTSECTYWRVCGWLRRCRMVVMSASLMRLSWQSITFFRMVLRPRLWATTTGFFTAAEQMNHTGFNHTTYSIDKCVCLLVTYQVHRWWRYRREPCGLAPVAHRCPRQWGSWWQTRGRAVHSQWSSVEGQQRGDRCVSHSSHIVVLGW